MIRGDSRNFVEWFQEQQLSGQIQGFVKGGAYFNSRSLKLGDCNYKVTISLKSKNDINHEN